MSKLVSIEDLLKQLGADTKEQLEEVIDNTAPSIAEYSLRSLMENNDISSYLDLSYVESIIKVGDFTIYFTYDDNCHIIENSVDKVEEFKIISL